MSALRLEAVDKVFPNGHAALRSLDLEAADGELLVLVGPSGCGKSTALRVVAGLEEPTRGRVWIDGRDATALAPGERDLAMVFQSYALYPHQSVRENLGFGLRMRRAPAPEIARRVARVAERLGLAHVLDRRPAQLSGGQRQRVALGRALARFGEAAAGSGARRAGPHALLLDEPLSNLDARLRLEMRAELARLHRELGATLLYVTHDQEEAMTLGDRIAVLREGGLEQVAPPLELYHRPTSVFVADFVGVPSINWLAPPDLASGSGLASAAPADAPLHAPGLRVGVRPHDLVLVPPERADLAAVADVVEALGSAWIVHARTESGAPLRVVAPADRRVRPGERVGVRVPPAALHVFDAASGRRLPDPASRRDPAAT
jgi:ABC-type sugar transport system ATPase subunit